MLSISDEHKEAIIRLVNLVIGDTPALTNLTDRSKVTVKLVKLIHFFENSVHSDQSSASILRCLSSAQLIENWLLNYYWEDPIMASFAIEDGLEQELSTACLLVLYVVYKWSVCLPHIVMYFNDNWTQLKQFDTQLDRMLKPERMSSIVTVAAKPRHYRPEPSSQSLLAPQEMTSDSFPCPECSRVFATRYKLRRHQFVHKPQSKPFKCIWNGCEQRFRASFDMRRHLVTHTGERPFECLTCGKRFTRADKLKEHLIVHNRSHKTSATTNANLNLNAGDTVDHVFDWSRVSLTAESHDFKSELDI